MTDMDGSTSKLSTEDMSATIASQFSDKTIALVGMMGVGKSTIGRQLAPILGRKFVDSDHEVEAAARLSITEIFDKMGEAEFRRGERAVIKRLLKGPPIVLATGGGAYLADETRTLLAKRAVTVWLDADIETLWERVSRRDTRPLLKQENPKAILTELNTARTAIYAKADIVVKSKDVSLDETVDMVLAELNRFGASKA